MYPYYDGTQTAVLKQDDIDGIQSIYGKATGTGGGGGGGGGSSEPASLLSEFRFDDGGLTAQDFSVDQDWLTGWKSAATLDGALFVTNTTPPLAKDSDYDGLPDWWEIANGLDPYDASGDNGAYGDPDHDGLVNLYEYFAGTEPDVYSTDGSGLSDFDSYASGKYLTWGEKYSDFDGVPDSWEYRYNLDPHSYDAANDPDADGWSNYAEYMGETDPTLATNHPSPSIVGHLYYSGAKSTGTNGTTVGQFTVFAYKSANMDDTPVKVVASNSVVHHTTQIIAVGNGILGSVSGVLAHENIVRGSIKVVTTITTNGPDFADSGTGAWTYKGTAINGSGATVFINYLTGDYSFAWRTGEAPAAGVNIHVTYDWVETDPNHPLFGISGITEGDVYLFAFLDRNANGTWDVGEPCGVLQDGPVRLEWGNVENVNIGIWDQADVPWFHRFSWGATGTNATSSNSTSSVFVRIYNKSTSTLLLKKWIKTNRSFFFDYDYQTATYTSGNSYYGLPTAVTYTWQVATDEAGGSSTVFASADFNYAENATNPLPALVSPVGGGEVQVARETMKWDMDRNSAGMEVQIGLTNGTWVLTNKFITPPRDYDGHFFKPFPVYFGDGIWTNREYVWRMRAFKPDGTTGLWSSVSATTNSEFLVNLQAPPLGMPAISGDVLYVGKANTTNALTNIVVEAFTADGFGGWASARRTLAYTCNTNSPSYIKGTYRLLGLRRDQYYVRAYVDLNANGKCDDWEPQGFYNDSYARPETCDLYVMESLANVRIVMRDRDTDNDGMPDGWEWMTLKTLAYGATDDTDHDGLSNLQEYQNDRYDSDPANPDTDGDGLLDGEEVLVYNTDPMRADTDGDGISDGNEVNLYHTNPLLTDSDGDGMSDLDEITAGTDPNDPLSTLRVRSIGSDLNGLTLQWTGKSGVLYRIQTSSDMHSWTDGNGVGELAGHSGVQSYTDSSVTNGGAFRYYRIKVVTP